MHPAGAEPFTVNVTLPPGGGPPAIGTTVADRVTGLVTIAPVFLLYDYTFRPEGALDKEQGLAVAYKTGIVCSDEALLYHDPYPSREDWCWARIEATERRLAGRDPALPVVFVSHYPLVREPTRVLRYPQFAQWCGTTRTHDWHVRYDAAAVVYGHLHIPRVTWYDGVRFEEVSIGYPREWKRRARSPRGPRQILPVPPPESDPPFGPPPARANPPFGPRA